MGKSFSQSMPLVVPSTVFAYSLNAYGFEVDVEDFIQFLTVSLFLLLIAY